MNDFESIDRDKKSELSSKALGRAIQLNRDARNCLARNDRQGAISCCLAALDNLGDAHQEERMGLCNNLGYLFVEQSQYDEALVWFRKAADIAQKIGNVEVFGRMMGNIGSVFRDKKEFSSAKKFYNSALDIFSRHGERTQIADQHSNLAYVYAMENRQDKARDHFMRAHALYKALGSQRASVVERNLSVLNRVASD